MTRETKALKNSRVLLDSTFSTPSDISLNSQVEICSISTQVFDSFGAATDTTFVHSRSTELEFFSNAYESWRHEWVEVLRTRLAFDQTSQTVLDMYFHSARLCLFSHVFRGPAENQSEPHSVSQPMDRFAHWAAQSAVSIVKGISELSEAHACPKLPFYFCAITAFASVFLLRGPWHTLYSVDKDRALQYLHRLIRLVSGPSAVVHAAHPMSSIAKSLRTAIGDLRQAEESGGGYQCDNLTYVDVNCDTLADGVLVPDILESGSDQLTFPYDVGLDVPDVGDFDFSCVEW